MSRKNPNPDDDAPEPRKLTRGIINSFRRILLAGNYRGVAARLIGIDPTTLSRWLTLGEQYPNGIYAELRREVLRAEALFEVQAVADIESAGQTDVTHKEWLLERKFPHRWGRYRGELGELKRQLAEKEKRIADLERQLTDLETGYGLVSGETADQDAG